MADFFALGRVFHEPAESAIGIVDALDRRLVVRIEGHGQILLRPTLKGIRGADRRDIVQGVPGIDFTAQLGVGRIVKLVNQVAKVERDEEAGHAEVQNPLADLVDGVIVQKGGENAQKRLGRARWAPRSHVGAEAQKALARRL